MTSPQVKCMVCTVEIDLAEALGTLLAILKMGMFGEAMAVTSACGALARGGLISDSDFFIDTR